MSRLLDALLRRPCVATREIDAAMKRSARALDDAADELTRAVREALDHTDRRRKNVGHLPERRKARA